MPWTTAFCLVASLAGSHIPKPSATPSTVRAAIGRALPALTAGAQGHVEQKSCFACHNQTYPVMAFSVASSRGFPLADQILTEQIEHVTEFVSTNVENYRSGKGTGGQVDTAAALLLTLEYAGAKPSDATTAVVEYLLKTQPERGHWRSTSNRPPTEVSHFTATALAARGLAKWKSNEQADRVKKRFASAGQWLATAKPGDTEDRVFQLFGMHTTKATKKELAVAAFELLSAQHADGGWAQISSLPSDPYATATTLVALVEAGGIKPDHPAYRAGVQFLLRTQRADGTWLVRSRSKPFQPYYESGFPHGANQFLSITATGWATTALALTLPIKPGIMP